MNCKAKKFFFTGICFFLFLYFGYSQSIKLVNPSFEEEVFYGPGQTPFGWTDCGFSGETPPDIQPGFFSVRTLPKHGNTYLGMVVRDNYTWEAIAQKLAAPLNKNSCYDFSMDLCRSATYLSFTKTSITEVSYAEPVRLRIWGGKSVCDKSELLYTTPIIFNTNWQTFEIRIQPKNDTYSYIVIEACYKDPGPDKFYNGNVLIDNISSLIPVNCKDAFKKDTLIVTQTIPVKTEYTPVIEAKIFKIEELKKDAKFIKKGDIVQLQKLFFDADRAIIKTECEPVLNDVYSFLKENPAVTIEIGGHTNNYPTDIQANELSVKRAKAVANWLIKKGIPENRIKYKGYGKTQPIASNETLEGREKNQRVEIKILNVQ